MRLERSYSPIIDNHSRQPKSHVTYLRVSCIAYRLSPVTTRETGESNEIEATNSVRVSSLACPLHLFQVFQAALPMMGQGWLAGPRN